MNTRDYVLKNKKKLHENRQRFQEIFGDNLEDYWDLTGFDVIKFDDLIKPIDGVSTEDTVREKYGQEAVDFVYSLM